jgi:hypothetical protein
MKQVVVYFVKNIHNGVIAEMSDLTHWNGIDGKSKSVASCVYFYRLKVGNNLLSSKLILVK